MARLDPRTATAAISAALLVAVPLAQKWEGYRGEAYLDPAKILTQCYGETRDVDPSRIYSKDECAVKLRARMAANYAPPLLDCVPSFTQPRNKHVFAAAIDASYNAGPVRVCARMAPLVNAGKIKEACTSLRGWLVSARDRKSGKLIKLPGLVNRRNDEADLCAKPVG